jgi:hypothetical protein
MTDAGFALLMILLLSALWWTAFIHALTAVLF